MINEKIKSTSREHSRLVVALIALVATVAILLLQMFLGVTNADEGVDVPFTSADVKDNGDEYLRIIGANLLYEDYLHINYGVYTNLDDGEYSEVKMLFWNAAQQDYTLETAMEERSKRAGDPIKITLGGVTYNNCIQFLSDGIAAKEIGDTVYARAYVTDSEGNVFYSNAVKYSVLDYVYSRYRDAELKGNVTDAQLHLYNSILTYGARAQVTLKYNTSRLVTSHGARIDVVDGHMTDGFATGVYLVGDSVTFVADADTVNGDFLYWKNSADDTIVHDRSFTITINNNTPNTTYTAVYSGVTTVNVVNGTLSDGSVFGSFKNGTQYTIVASNGELFSHWEDETGANLGSSETLTLTAGEGTVTKTYTAVNFQPAKVTVVNGTLSGADSDGYVAYRETFAVTADDKSGEKKVFKAWVDASGNVLGTDLTLEVPVTPDLAGKELTYTATYYDPTTVNVVGGTVGGKTQATVAYGDSYTIVAEDKTAEKLVFKHWSDGNAIVGTDMTFTAKAVESGASKTYTAVYYAPSTITVTNGTVNGAATATVAYGDSYTVSAVVPGAFVFDGWTKNGETLSEGKSFTATAGEGENVEYVAILRNNTGAGFDSNGQGALVSGTPIESDGYTVTLNGSSEAFGASITQDPKKETNNVLKLSDLDGTLGGGVSLNSFGDGSFAVFKTKVYFDSFSTGSVLQISFGDAYKLQFTAVEDAALRIYDVSGPSSSAITGYLDCYVRPGEWNEIKIVFTTLDGVNDKAPRAFVYLNNTCVAESYNVVASALPEAVTLYAVKDTTVTAYFDDVALYSTDMSAEDESLIEAVNVFEEVTSASANRFQNVEILLGSEALAAIEKMDDELFSEDVYLWVAKLYDPESGAFYFSVSGSENYGYLADIETTSQASGVLNSLGIGTLSSLLNAEQKAKLLSWVQSLQSNRDGYLYHPQWGISIGDARRSRDYSYSSASFDASGSLKFRLYNDANYRLSGGTTGTKGVTVPTEYDNSKSVALTSYSGNLTSPLGISVQSAASKVILAASTSADSNVPVHMRSEEAFVDYINRKWNSGCDVDGTHERHLCTDSCVQVADENDSYMTLENGKVKFVRGQRCTSCHECKHSVGHSYGFASVIGTQNSQIKSLGLGDLLVGYYYDVQENVQASLRHKVELAYTGNDGTYAWSALSNVSQKAKADAVTVITDEAKALAETEYNASNGAGAFTSVSDAKKNELYKMAEAKLLFIADINENGATYWAGYSDEVKADLKRQNQNGIWEEEVTYGTISGLLKACGTPGHHGYEFLYAEDAIQSAIDCALFSVYDFTVLHPQSVVSIYNPFNAINGVMGNIRNYGSDKTLVDKCMKLIRSQAAELIENTTGKLKGYLQPDGGFSYNYGGYCITSQGQPVAINGWNNGAGEGDVNGTALAFGTRSALLSVMGVSVSAPFSGSNNIIEGGYDLNEDGYVDDYFDLDGDGEAETFEGTCTHTQRFKYIITNKAQIEKVDVSSDVFTYTFEDGIKASGKGEIVAEKSDNNVIEVTDDLSTSGVSTTFAGASAVADNNNSNISFRMKVKESNNTTSHQLFAEGSGTALQINFVYSSGMFTFTNVASSSKDLVDKTTGANISVDATNWFTVNITINHEGETVNGTTYYGTFSVTQNGTTQTAYIPELYSNSAATSVRMFSLKSAVTTTWYDDFSVVTNVLAGVHDGEYHFDTVSQQIAGSDVLVQNPATGSYDKVYLLNGKSTVFAAYNYSVDDYTTNNVRYNFDSAQLGLLLNEANAGDRIDVAMLDSQGRKITGFYLVVSEYEGKKLVTFYAPNGNVLEESIPRTVTTADGDVVTTAELREMILEVDTVKWMTIKLEYHYDMADPQLDIVVRYADNTKDGYYTSTAACLTGIDVCDTGADAFNFANLSVKATGKIYLDDLYIRNVYDACDGNHVFIKKATKAFLTGESENGHNLYYTSCQKCGAKNTDETFVVHEFERIVDAAYKVSDATIYSAAIYKESCSVCKAASDSTFTYGRPLDDPSKWNFTDASGAESSYPTYVSVATASDGSMWAKLMSEQVGDVVNYYMNVGKLNNGQTNALTFAYKLSSGESIANKYIYELDLRWQGASDHVSAIMYVKAGVINNGKKVEKSTATGTFSANSAGNYANYNGITFYSGEWHALKYLYSRNSTGDGWDLTVFIDGLIVQESSFIGDGVPYITFETRYGRTENEKYYPNNVNFDIDRLKATKVETEGHELDSVIADRYLAAGATCLTPTTYYKSCKWCGKASDTETFTVGSVSGHSYANVLSDTYIKTAATCEAAAVYYKSCKICGEKADSTFTYGDPLGHSDVKTVVTAATNEKAEVCYFTCSVCGRQTEAEENGLPLSWTFSEEYGMNKLATKADGVGYTISNSNFNKTGSLYASVKSETVSGAVNYYLNVGKNGSASTNTVTIKSTEDGKSSYSYEFKLRWNSADTFRSATDTACLYIKALNDSTGAKYETLQFKADADPATTLTAESRTLAKSTWYTLRFDYTLNTAGDTWTCKIYLNNSLVKTYSAITNTADPTATPFVLIEPRWGSGTNYVNIDIDLDNIKVSAN